MSILSANVLLAFIPIPRTGFFCLSWETGQRRSETETPTIQQTSNSKPSVSTPYSRTLPALPRPRYCIGLVGTEQEKQALQKERLTKFMIQQATGRRFVPEVLKGAGAFCRSIATRKIGCSESTFMALLHFAVLLRARVLVPLAMLVDRFMKG